MFDPGYAWLYFVAGLFAVTPLALIMFPRVKAWSDNRTDHRDISYGVTSLVGGVTLFAFAQIDDWLFDAHKVPDAVLKSMATLMLLLGLILLVLRVFRTLRDRDLARKARPGR
jgi:hypothetical protein